MKLEYIGQADQFYLFKYKVDGEDEITRVRKINDGKNYELSIGFGDFRTKMIIDSLSRMGRDVTNQIGKDEA